MCVHVAKHSCNTHVCITRHRCLLITKSQGRSLGSHGKRGKAEKEEEEEENNSHGESLNLLKIPSGNREKSNDLLSRRKRVVPLLAFYSSYRYAPVVKRYNVSISICLFIYLYILPNSTQKADHRYIYILFTYISPSALSTQCFPFRLTLTSPTLLRAWVLFRPSFRPSFLGFSGFAALSA